MRLAYKYIREAYIFIRATYISTYEMRPKGLSPKNNYYAPRYNLIAGTKISVIPSRASYKKYNRA